MGTAADMAADDRTPGGCAAALAAAYEAERERLLALAERDEPQGEYARPIFGAGEIGARAVLIGEAPGAEETKLGRPFVGKAGRQLDELFSLFGVSRAEVYITNAVKYRPVVRSERTVRNRTPGRDEVAAALPLLRTELLKLTPRVVLTLGNTPLWAVCRLCGEAARTVGEAHGVILPVSIGPMSFELIPLYHPASGIYNRALIEVMERDAKFVGSVLARQSGGA